MSINTLERPISKVAEDHAEPVLSDKVRRCAAVVLLSNSTAESHPELPVGTLVMAIMRRQKADGSLGKGSLPKGEVEEGESIIDAALREAGEEVGLRKGDLESNILFTGKTYERTRASRSTGELQNNVIHVCVASVKEPTELKPTAADAGWAGWLPVDQAVEMIGHHVARECVVETLGKIGVPGYEPTTYPQKAYTLAE